MNTFINYLIEANLGLCLFVILYFVFLKNETDFRISRFIMLSGIIASILFPMVHINLLNTSIPSLRELMPSYFLPQITIGTEGPIVITDNEQNFGSILEVVYFAGVLFFFLVFAFQVFKLIRLVNSSITYSSNNLIIAESDESKLTFSFFNFVFIGQSNSISSEEKRQILNHERIHAQQWHSFDIILLNLLKIIFWFNPIIFVYKKIFIQLHEFEADARAVDNKEVNEYCSLLARVALQSADFTIANHFNQSLTLKRIAMMQTMKTKIKIWKVAIVMAVFPVFFVLTACQDQVTSDLTTVANSAAVSLDIPTDIQTQLNKIKAANPGKEYVIVESTTEEGKTTLEKIDVNQIASMNVIKSGDRSFIIIERNQQNISFAEKASTDNVFTIVEQMPEYVGGHAAMLNYISSNIQYPESAKNDKIEGTAFASFVVNKDGSISDVQVMKSLNPSCDKEAIRVIQLMPNWIPGKQKGEPVNVRFVLPIRFSLG